MKKLIILLIVTLFVSGSPAAFAGDREPDKRVVLIVANQIGLLDLIDSPIPNIRKSLGARAAAGLMNVRGAMGARNSADAYMSIGSGARAKAGSFGHLAGERGEILILEGVAQKPVFTGKGEVATPSFPDISRQNAKLSYPVSPGALGEALRLAGVKRTVLGNADVLGAQHREINLIAMDRKGVTDFGGVGKTINSPAAALAAIEAALTKSTFVALDYGPAGTIDGRIKFLSDQEVKKARTDAVRDIDAIFGRLLERVDGRDTMVILIAPQAASSAPAATRSRTPVIVAADGFRGLLTSGGTRWDGLITNRDIAPTILTWLDVPVPELLTGWPAIAKEHPDPLNALRAMETRVLTNYPARSVLLSPYITLSVILMSAAGLALLFVRGAKRLLYLQPACLALMFAPAVILIHNGPPNQIPGLPIALVPVGSLLLGWATWSFWRNKPAWASAAPALLIVPIILIQLPLDSFLERDSILGMSSVIGARFYGIGNEYAGILLGASAIAVTALMGKTRVTLKTAGWIASIFFVILTLVIGLPALGANVGGSLAAVACAVIIFQAIRGISLRPRHLGLIVAGMGLSILGILAADYFGAAFSHAFRTAALAGNGNPQQIMVTISRKLSTNVRLITHTSWTNILIAAGLVTLGLKHGAPDLWDRVLKENPLTAAARQALVPAGLVALIFNDSGVVMAALMIFYAVFSWLYLMIDAAAASPADEWTIAGQVVRKHLSVP